MSQHPDTENNAVQYGENKIQDQFTKKEEQFNQQAFQNQFIPTFISNAQNQPQFGVPPHGIAMAPPNQAMPFPNMQMPFNNMTMPHSNMNMVPSNMPNPNMNMAPSNMIMQNPNMNMAPSNMTMPFPNMPMTQTNMPMTSTNMTMPFNNMSIPPSGALPQFQYDPLYINPPKTIGQFQQQNSSAKNSDFNQRQIDEQKKEIYQLKNQINSLFDEKNKIEIDSKAINSQNNQLKHDLERIKIELDEVRMELIQKVNEIQESKKINESQLKEFKNKLQQEIDLKQDEKEAQDKIHKAEINKLNLEIQNLNAEIQRRKEENNNSLMQQNEIKNLKAEVQNQKKQILDLQIQITEKDTQIAEKSKQIENYKLLKIKEDQDQQVVANLQKQLSDLSQKINEITQENKHLQALKNQFEDEYKNMQTQCELNQIDIQRYKNLSEMLQKSLDEAYSQQEKQNKANNSNELTQGYQEQLRQLKEQRENQRNIEQEKYNLEKERIQQKYQEEQQKQKQLNILGKQKMMENVRKAGQIQCCFLLDIYKSDLKTGQAIIKATEKCCTLIKQTTNRDSSWGTVCYGYDKKDFIIKESQFSNSSDVLSGFLKKQKTFKDTKDEPEDLKTALQKMLQLNWSEKYRLAIVIANSPCHGKRYHNPKKYVSFWFFSKDYDRKPNEDIEGVIKEIVKKDIVLLVIRFNDETKVMCSELEKLYSKLGYPQFFHTLSVKGLDQQNSDIELSQQIQKMAAFIIGTDNRTTRTKINQNVRMQNFDEGQNEMKNLKEDVLNINNEVQKEMQKQGDQKQQEVPQNLVQNAIEDIKQYHAAVERIKDCTDGALQALCKKGDISKFERIVKCEDFSCKVYKVELKQESFQKKMENIEQIRYDSDDFDLKVENEWQCVRTQNPFAYGMMKAVYLMKKRNNTEEIYVVKIPIEKGPYKSKAQAVDDCRSHLIAKNLMKIFMEEIMNKNQGIQMVQYTDFLLLEENESKYWIAERFFKGNFEKYNNNDGFISDDKSQLNAISQGFSYYTYQKSQFNYIINDIQGIGNYFTDPAINTIKGNFDETDVGEDGISGYLTILQLKKGTCQDLLKSIDIEID